MEWEVLRAKKILSRSAFPEKITQLIGHYPEGQIPEKPSKSIQKRALLACH
jgi:hypothetical protein